MIAIIFGVTGQDGYYLHQLLTQEGIDVVGVSRANPNWIRGDVADFEFVKSLIRSCQPDYVFHLAANSTTHHSALFENNLSISNGTINILEAVKLCCVKTKVFLSGSAMQFENNGLPIYEKTPFEASSPYSIARIHSVYSGRYYRKHFGIRVYVGYLFNHDSPLRGEKHVNQKIALAVKRIAEGSKEKIELGNLDVKKEFNFAGDIVNAIWKLVEQDEIFEAVIGSGITFTIKNWLEGCFAMIGLPWEEFVVLNKGYSPEYMVLVSDPQLIKSIGWQPKIAFDQLVDLMMRKPV